MRRCSHSALCDTYSNTHVRHTSASITLREPTILLHVSQIHVILTFLFKCINKTAVEFIEGVFFCIFDRATVQHFPTASVLISYVTDFQDIRCLYIQKCHIECNKYMSMECFFQSSAKLWTFYHF